MAKDQQMARYSPFNKRLIDRGIKAVARKRRKNGVKRKPNTYENQ